MDQKDEAVLGGSERYSPSSTTDSAFESLKSNRSFRRDWDFKESLKLPTQQDYDSGCVSGSALTNMDFGEGEVPLTEPEPEGDPYFVQIGGSKFMNWPFTKEKSKLETKRRGVSLPGDRPAKGDSDLKESRPERSVSLNKDSSLNRNWDFRKEAPAKQLDQNETLDSIFVHLEENIIRFVKAELKQFCRVLAVDHPECLVNKDDEGHRSREAFLTMTLDFLRMMKQEELAERLHYRSCTGLYQRRLKSALQRKFSHVYEGVTKEARPTPLNQIYTELYITEGGAPEVNQHEFRHIEAVSRKQMAEEVTITCEDIFKGSPDRRIRAVLTKGVAGIGKTVLTQKFCLDWAEGKANHDVQLLFPFSFKELNILKGSEFNLVGLLYHFFSETQGLSTFEDFQLLFIFDGLDECRLPLDFGQARIITDPTECVAVEELLVNLIRGSLLPYARLWITTRPTAASQIPAECFSLVTEVRGFGDLQKEQYFKTKFKDKQLSTAVILHIKSIRTLYIMCHIPIFCWILYKVLLYLIKTRESAVLPHTLTQMYIHFIVILARVKNLKYDSHEVTDQPWTSETKEMLQSLGKLAFEQLKNGNLIFYERDLKESGLDATTASVHSGLFTQVLREESGLYQNKVYHFIHLSVQEFLAALHVHQTFYSSGENLLRAENALDSQDSMDVFYQTAIDQALLCQNGHWDLFLRFLLGLSLPTNQRLLHGLLLQTGGAAAEVAVYLKLRMNEVDSTERALNLFHCLHELEDSSLFDFIHSSLRSGQFSKRLSPAQWSALAFILLSTNDTLDTFDLNNFCASEDVLLRLMPLVKASNKAILTSSSVREEGCAALSKALRCESSCLKQLDLSYNSLKDSGVRLLAVGLQTSHCTLQDLRLQRCCLTEDCCKPLSSILSHSNLRLLDLSNNDLTDNGVEKLSVGLKNPMCKMQTLRLSGCVVSGKGYYALTAALKLNPSHLKELDLSYNHAAPSVKLLPSVEKKLEKSLTTLRLTPCGKQFLKPGLKKYFCELTLDMNTAYRKLKLSEDNRTVIFVEDEQPYPSHEDRFDWYPQVLCSTALAGRHYWELEWSGVVSIAVSYKDISRKGADKSNTFGQNSVSWRLWCSDRRLSVCVDEREQYLDLPATDSLGRVAVFLDCPAGFLSFYRILESRLVHLHTFHTNFTQPLFAGLGFGSRSSSATLITE